MATPAKDKAKIALGVMVVVVVCLSETITAHRIQPNPLSVYVWTGLGMLAGGALIAYFHFRRIARSEDSAKR